MLGRRGRRLVLAEVPASQGAGSRPGALGRPQLEAYSGLAVALAGSRAVLATGPAKSDVALGLAAAASAEGRRVVLLEADLAAPALAGRLGLAAGPGLREYLLGEAEPPQILQSLVLAGPASGRAAEPLTCIAGGAPEPSPAALLDSDRCLHATGKLRRAYDLFVIDGPPAGPDSGPLRALADQVDAIVACGARREIPKRLPVPVAGVVLFS